jgi:hypothetical protein
MEFVFHKLRLGWRVMIQIFKQVWLIPQAIAGGFKQRRRQMVLDEREAERLDRIRHPWKYRGK